MKRLLATCAFLAGLAGHGMAATAVNLDGEPRTIVVTENGERTEIEIAAGQSADFCPKGCFVTMPNGDREALTGAEAIEISGGVGRVK